MPFFFWLLKPVQLKGKFPLKRCCLKGMMPVNIKKVEFLAADYSRSISAWIFIKKFLSTSSLMASWKYVRKKDTYFQLSLKLWIHIIKVHQYI